MDNNMNFSKDLIKLIRRGESDERVKEILDESFLYNTADASGATLLHYSVRYNNINLTQYLLDKNCDVNVQDSKGITPLMIAALEDHDELVKILFKFGADIFKVNYENKNVLQILSMQHDINYVIMQLLLQKLIEKCNSKEEIAKKLVDSEFPLYLTILSKDSEVIEHMIKRNNSSVHSAHISYKITAMHLACALDDLKSVTVLLKYGADANALDFMNRTPLNSLYKVFKEHNREKIEILKLLVNQRVSLTSVTLSGGFQAFYVLTEGNSEAIRVLLESGLDFNVENIETRQNALHHLAVNTNPGIANILKRYIDKFNVNSRDKFGQTPLLIATYEGNFSMIKFLLENQAKTELKHNVFGTTSLYYAYERSKLGFEKKYHRCGEILLQYGANPQFVGVNSQTGKLVTIFDAAFETKDFNRIKPVIAHLAILEKFGRSITDITLEKINSQRFLQIHFFRCRRLLNKRRIFGRVTLFDLLVSDRKKMARYLNNQNILQIMNAEKLKNKLLYYRYFYNLLKRRYLEGKRYQKLKSKAAKIICKVFQNRIDETHFIVDKIIDYLNDENLQQLCRLLS